MSSRSDLVPDGSIASGRMQKISDWLNECGSHEIYSVDFIAKDFEEKTRQKFPTYIRTYSWKETKRVMEARGLGGSLNQSAESQRMRLVWGYRMAEDFARHLVGFVSDKSGRGRIFWESIAALEKGGM